MNIIHITPSYKPAYLYGGPTQSVSRLCEVLSKNDTSEDTDIYRQTNIQVFTTTANGKTELLVTPSIVTVVEGVKVIYFNRWTKDHSHFSPSLLLKLLQTIRTSTKERQKTIIHIHAWWNLVSLLSFLISKLYRIPIVLSPRGMLNTNTISSRKKLSVKKIFHYLFGKKLLSHCIIHATSNKEKEEILNFNPNYKVKVIPNIIHLPELFDLKTNSQGTSSVFNLFFISRINPIKGLDLLFEALALLNFEWSLTIAGTGESVYINSLKELANKLKISHRIVWLGHLDNLTKFNILGAQDLTILTSKSESFANVVVESLSVGTPVLISDQVGLSDYVREKDLGWVTTLNEESISEGILAALRDSQKRVQIRETAPAIIRSDFSDEVLVERYMDMYTLCG